MVPRHLRLRAYRRGRLVRDTHRGIVRDFCMDHYSAEGRPVFEGCEVGMVIAVDTISFPYVGEVVAVSDAWVRLKNAVKILWDGRHGEYAKGRPPESAEIEATYPVITINVDAVIAWGPYPGKKIPAAH